MKLSSSFVLLVSFIVIGSVTAAVSKAAKRSKSTRSFIQSSSCPINDQINLLIPWQLTVDDDIATRSLLVYVPPELCYILLRPRWHPDPPKLRILLAIHGYGGQPEQEIVKWHSTAVALQSVIIAPQGTRTISNNRLGWNAIDCCGDPVTNDVDDLGFLHKAVDTVTDTLLNFYVNKTKHVIVTGFSNGGFLTSLVGLQTTNRLESLVGIVPTAGYQYDLAMYDNFQSEAFTLPMMAHHPGRDGVVKPDGCCNTGSGSNCPLEIGVNAPTCTSVQTAFDKWSQINQCKSTSIDNGLSNTVRTCWKGNECLAPTELCIWTNEGHGWGSYFPGADLARSWMEELFLAAESTN